MLTESKKQELINHIYTHLRESLMERLFGEESTDEDDIEEIKRNIRHGKNKKNKEKEKQDGKSQKDKKIGKKRKEVMDWLKDSQSDDVASYSINHADLMRQLWHPESQEEEDALRSRFSKCLNHSLEFSDEDINNLYNMKGDIGS